MHSQFVQQQQASSSALAACVPSSIRVQRGRDRTDRMHVVILEARQHVDNELQFFATVMGLYFWRVNVFLQRVENAKIWQEEQVQADVQAPRSVHSQHKIDLSSI